MKKYFLTGLVLLLPLALTTIIVLYLFTLLTEPFIGIVQTFLNAFDLFSNGFLFFSADEVQVLISRLLILVILFFFTVFIGLVTRLVFVHYFVKIWDHLIHRIPYIRSLYKICQDVINTLFRQDTTSFKQVVLVRFPNANALTVGFVTRRHVGDFPNSLGAALVAVFVPTAPNPTSGFLMLCKEEELVPLDLSVDEALKYVISCGVITPDFVKSH